MSRLIQVRYVLSISPRGCTERDMLEIIWAHWLKTGETPPGCTITATDWHRGELTWRECQSFVVGCPGVVRWYGESRLILCDYDFREPPGLPEIWARLGRLKYKAVFVEYHKTERGWHVTIELNRRMRKDHRIALQAILGSDPKREAFNLARQMTKLGRASERSNLLFERKL